MKTILFSVKLVIIVLNFTIWGAELSMPFTVCPSVLDGMPQYCPVVAYSDSADLWLVVWQDGLSTGDESSRGGRAQDIFAARVKGDGTVLDPTGIPVCTAPDFQSRPSVVSDGKGFFIVWHDMRNGKDWDVYGARVGANGTVLDPNGFLISGGNHNQCLPEVVCGTNSYFVAWLDARHMPEYSIYGSRISLSGSVLDPEGNQIIRPMKASEFANWSAAPFTPGKIGQGWNTHAYQPAAFSLGTNGTRHMVYSRVNRFGYSATDKGLKEGYSLTQTIDAETGDTVGSMNYFDLEPYIGSVTGDYQGSWRGNRMPLMNDPLNNLFFSGSVFYNSGFGASNDVKWVLFRINYSGQTANLPQVILHDSLQVWNGYRTHSVKPTTFKIAGNGEKVLCVANSHRHSGTDGRADILGVGLDNNGNVVGGGFSIAADGSLNSYPSISSGSDGNFLVVWQQESRTSDARIAGRIVKP